MSDKVSRLFAADRGAEIAYTKALKAQYGDDFEKYRYSTATHNGDTQQARVRKHRALMEWHKAALGK